MPAKHYIGPVLALWGEAREQAAYTVAGNCMAPLIREGDRIVVQHGRQGVRVGDIVLCRLPEGFRVQRVIHCPGAGASRRILVKGDQVVAVPPPLTPDRIVGRVVAVVGRRGRLHLDRPAVRAMNLMMASWSRFSAAHQGSARIVRRMADRLVAAPCAAPASRSDTNRLRDLLRRFYDRSSRGRTPAVGRTRRTD